MWRNSIRHLSILLSCFFQEDPARINLSGRAPPAPGNARGRPGCRERFRAAGGETTRARGFRARSDRFPDGGLPSGSSRPYCPESGVSWPRSPRGKTVADFVQLAPMQPDVRRLGVAHILRPRLITHEVRLRLLDVNQTHFGLKSLGQLERHSHHILGNIAEIYRHQHLFHGTDLLPPEGTAAFAPLHSSGYLSTSRR